MFIAEILSQHRRDIKCLFKCEHCGHTETGFGYDDSYYHETALPDVKCKSCTKTANLATYIPRKPRYPDSVMI